MNIKKDDKLYIIPQNTPLMVEYKKEQKKNMVTKTAL